MLNVDDITELKYKNANCWRFLFCLYLMQTNLYVHTNY